MFEMRHRVINSSLICRIFFFRLTRNKRLEFLERKLENFTRKSISKNGTNFFRNTRLNRKRNRFCGFVIFHLNFYCQSHGFQFTLDNQRANFGIKEKQNESKDKFLGIDA